jgi:hypothetical protein
MTNRAKPTQDADTNDVYATTRMRRNHSVIGLVDRSGRC